MTDHCLSRSNISSLVFDWMVSAGAVLLDERAAGITGAKFEAPTSAPWWFFKFRMYSQSTVLVVYVI